VKSGRLGIPVLLFSVLSSEYGTQGLVLSQVEGSVFSRIGAFDCNRDTAESPTRTSQYYDEGEDLYRRFAQSFDDGEVRTITLVQAHFQHYRLLRVGRAIRRAVRK